MITNYPQVAHLGVLIVAMAGQEKVSTPHPPKELLYAWLVQALPAESLIHKAQENTTGKISQTL